MWCLCRNGDAGLLFGEARRKLGEVFHALVRQKEFQIIEVHLLPDRYANTSANKKTRMVAAAASKAIDEGARSRGA